MKSQLKKLEEIFREHRPNYLNLLQEGVDDNAIKLFQKKTGQVLPEKLEALYKWKNGQNINSYDPIQNNQTFMSLPEVMETKVVLDGMIGFDFDDPEYWKKEWIPFLHNGGGSYLCFDIGDEYGQLIAFWKGDEDRPVEYQSLEEWLNEISSSTQDGSIELY